MSLLESPALPPVPTAPHSRVQHMFYTAPYIRFLFERFLEGNPESNLLETDAVVQTLSHIYLIGIAHKPDFWKETAREALEAEKERYLAELALLRGTRGKTSGRHQWSYFRTFFRALTGKRLPSRKSREVLSLTDERAEMKLCTTLAILALKIYEAAQQPIPEKPAVEVRPKRITGRISRHSKKTEP